MKGATKQEKAMSNNYPEIVPDPYVVEQMAEVWRGLWGADLKTVWHVTRIVIGRPGCEIMATHPTKALALEDWKRRQAKYRTRHYHVFRSDLP
jgi:hypothetical protein